MKKTVLRFNALLEKCDNLTQFDLDGVGEPGALLGLLWIDERVGVCLWLRFCYASCRLHVGPLRSVWFTCCILGQILYTLTIPEL